MYDIIVVGGGPAGMTAAIYASRYGRKVAIFEKEMFGGQINNSPRVDNIPGYYGVPGIRFSEAMAEQVVNCGVDIFYEEVLDIQTIDGGYRVETTDGIDVWDKKSHGFYDAKGVIVAVGCNPRTLGLAGEEELIGNGIHFCATCDGMFYKNKNVVVIGGGNSALVEAIELAKICKSVTILQNLDHLTADQTLIDEYNKFYNTGVVYNCVFTKYEVMDGKLTGVWVTSEKDTNFNVVVKTDGIFMCIGQVPSTNFLKNNDLFLLDKSNYIDEAYDAGVVACGDCVASQDLRQVVTACAVGAKAAFYMNDRLKEC